MILRRRRGGLFAVDVEAYAFRIQSLESGAPAAICFMLEKEVHLWHHRKKE